MTPNFQNSFIQKSNLSFLIDTRSKTDDNVVCALFLKSIKVILQISLGWMCHYMVIVNGFIEEMTIYDEIALSIKKDCIIN